MQDTKLIQRNLLHFYTLTKNYQKEKLRKTIPFIFSQKRKKYLGVSLPKGDERPGLRKLYHTDERK